MSADDASTVRPEDPPDALTSLGDVLITPELDRRPSRPPDYERQARALDSLAGSLAGSPDDALQALTEVIVELCDAGSAGVSLSEDAAGNPTGPRAFRWVAVAGAWADKRGNTLLMDASPCGVVVERNQVLLFAHPERHFPAPDVHPPITELLLVPFHLGGTPVGTLWAVAHDGARKFDREDVRLLLSLSRSAATMVQTTRSLADLRGSEERTRRIVEGVKDHSIFTTDATGVVTDWTPGAEAVFGWPAAEIVGQTAELLFTPEDRAAGVPSRELAAAREASCAPDERWHVRRDGSRFFANGSVRPLHGADGEVVGFIKIARDETEQRAAEAALREGEARFQALVNSIDQMVWSTRPDGFHDFYNQRWYDYTGVPPGSTDGEAWNGMFHPDDQDRAWTVWRRSLETGEPYHIEYRLRHRSGQYRWVLGRAQCVRDDQGRIARWYGTCTDIEEIVQAREVLARSREELEAAVTARTAERNRVWAMSRDLLAVIGFDGFLKAVNPAWETTLGLDEAALLARPLGEQVHPDDLAAAGEIIERLRRGEVVERFEDRLRHADGSWRWISWGLVPEGDVFYAVGRDVTEEKERAAALRLYENIVQSDNAPICAFDTDFRLIAFNKAHNDEFERVNGFRTKIGEVFPDLFLPDQAPVIRGFMARALAGEVFTVTEEFGDPDLSKPYWEVAYTPLRDDAGQIIGAFHHAQDITARLRAQAELAQAQEALRQAQKMDAMGQLTGGVAHDFNNLLTPIMGVLDRLLNRGAGDERERRLMAGALESAERAKVLVQRLLAFARRQPLQPTAVDLSRLIGGMAELIGSTLGPKITVRVELASSLPPARADANQLEMALLNLAVNARDAMPDGGTLAIRATREGVRGKHSAGLKIGHYVRLSVADTGIGMDAATRERAVEPFFSTKGIGKGTGLGLSMVHGLAAQLGGGLVIASEPGRGTIVELWLPISAGAIDEAESARTVPRPAASRGCALLVDDEELVRMSTADMLADLGFDVLEAGSAEEALRLLHEGTAVDLLVTDHLMPGMSGAELARELKVLRPGLPILIVSGYADVDGLAPDLPRLTKPFRAAELAQRVADLMPGTSPAG